MVKTLDYNFRHLYIYFWCSLVYSMCIRLCHFLMHIFLIKKGKKGRVRNLLNYQNISYRQQNVY